MKNHVYYMFVKTMKFDLIIIPDGSTIGSIALNGESFTPLNLLEQPWIPYFLIRRFFEVNE